MQRFSKNSPLGGFQVEVEDDGVVRASIRGEGALREFKNAQEAAYFFAPMAQENHSAWNVCYTLEDFL